MPPTRIPNVDCRLPIATVISLVFSAIQNPELEIYFTPISLGRPDLDRHRAAQSPLHPENLSLTLP